MHGSRKWLFNPKCLWFVSLVFLLAGYLLFGRPAHGDCDTTTALTPLGTLSNPQQGQALANATPVSVAGIVSGVFPGREGLNGFFIQDSHLGEGAQPAGLFVYAPGFTLADWARIEVGSHVQVAGLSGEHRGRPQLQRVNDLRICALGEPPDPVALDLPVDTATLEALHGVLVSFPQPLTVTGNYTLGRYGSLTLSQAGRLFRTGHADQRLKRLILDDGSYLSYPKPVPYLDDAGTRRAGDTVHDLVGILVHAFNDWRVHPTQAPRFTNTNPRPTELPSLTGMRVATFNLENYFLSLGERGARDVAALERQRGKLLTALEAKNADLLALVEVENRRDVLLDLISRLNARLPEADHYRLLNGPADTGTDAIKVALVYRPRVLEPLAQAQTDNRRQHNRPPVMAAFRDRESGERFVAAVVHFKAKSGCPDRGDIDRGQGCWNERRTAQAHALVEAVEKKAQRKRISHVLLTGDFNSYAGEDPVMVIENAGYVDLVAEHLPPEGRYTYVFRGEAGTLDYLFASASLANRVTGAFIWHINADEPVFLAYDQPGGRAAGGSGQPWRSSDHDPVMIGIAW